jgi:hypothetical protein
MSEQSQRVVRLKANVNKLRTRLAQANTTIDEHTHFRTQTLTRFGAQREEIHQPSIADAPTPV